MEGSRSDFLEMEVLYAMMSVHLHIPFPEQLPEDLFVRKLRQLEWAMLANHLPVKLKGENARLLPEAEIIKTDAEETD